MDSIKPNPAKDVVFVVGPTATGKTDLAIKIAQQHNGSVISADSRQIYFEMDIGTAKAAVRRPIEPVDYTEPIQIEGIDHYLIDIAFPDQRYTLFEFKTQAEALIQQLQKEGKLPIVAGGTGLYADSLINNYQMEPEDHELREELEKLDGQTLWEKLNEVDPESAESLHPNDQRRVLRKLEIAMIAGEKLERSRKPDFNPIILEPKYERQDLYEKIEKRIDWMVEQGLVEETENLLEKYDENLPALSSLGYKEIGEYLKGERSLDEALYEFKKHTRHFAKRQISWFRRYKNKILV